MVDSEGRIGRHSSEVLEQLSLNNLNVRILGLSISVDTAKYMMTPPLSTTMKMTCVIEATRSVSSRASTKLRRRLGGGKDRLSLPEPKPKVGVLKKPSKPYSNCTTAASRAETGSCSQSHPHLILSIRLLIPKMDM